MKISKVILLLLVIQVFSSCKKSEWLKEGDYFFLENEEAIMPVWVKGNKNSNVYILTVHGGPGATSGHEFPISKGFKLLENDYNVIYWDQRMSGLAQGDPDPKDMTVDQHIEDLSKLIQLINHNYSPESLFLLGHSWGGVMTGGYLGLANNQYGINGWIDVDGSIQEEFEVQEMKKWILDKLPMYYDSDPVFYQYIIDWYEENPHPKQSDPEPYWYSNNLGGYAYDYENSSAISPIPFSELAFSSPFTWAFYWTQYDPDGHWSDGYDVTEEVSNINIPSLLLWGEEDGVVTAEVAQFTYDYLKTDPMHKYKVLIPNCAHSPHYDAPDRFYSETSGFIEKYK